MRQALANLATIMIRPRAVMRRILDAGRDRMIIPLVLLATISAIVGDLHSGERRALQVQGWQFALIVVGVLAGVTLLMLALFYLFSWAAFGLGKVLEGTGSPREVRSAMAWGLAPAIWAMLYRIPSAIFWPRSEGAALKIGDFSLNTGREGMTCLVAAILGLLELTMFVWLVIVTSNTIGEAHRFSSWRGLATLLLVAISPAIIILAAVLAM
jgi:hypothetical protein